MSLRDPLAIAQDLIRCPSVTPEDAGAIGLLAQALQTLGFTCHEIVSATGGPTIRNLYARRGTSAPNFCFAGHTDVVPAGPGWTVPPFEGVVRDGHLFGRGAADMKGGIACFVAAVARFLAEGQPRGSISLLITGDEEGPAVDGTVKVLDWLKQNGETIDLCLVGEPTSPLRLGEMMKIGRRGSLNARLRVFGTGGHSAYPHLADNPVLRLIRMLQKVTEQPLDHGSEHFEPSTLALTTVDVANPATNVIPGEARAGFNIRFNDLHSGASLERWIRTTLDGVGGRYQCDIEVCGESFLTSPGPLSETVARAAQAVTGLAPELSTTGGTSDARFIKNCCPVLEFGLVSQTIHKPDENVSVDDLENLTKIYHLILQDIIGG